MIQQTPPARVRFAPSPTGHLHLGGARTALYCFLLARQTAGQFILRIEDTDRRRYQPRSEQELMDSLHWLGLEWDEGPDVGGPYGPYRQSERKAIYQAHARDLLEGGHAYYCFCSPERLSTLREEQLKRKETPHYDGLCRRLDPLLAKDRADSGEPHTIRFKTPRQGTITVRDRLRGEITFENKNLDDYILVKSDGLALYHLAVVVDDHRMDITHTIRGAEWLPTFPLHAHIYRAFGWQEPEWIHLSVFLKPSGKGKMSKREAYDLKQSGHSIFIKDLKEMGYLPEAVINWISLMGWSFDDRTEFFTMPDLIQKFDIDRLNPSPAAINFSKLDHFNGLHIRQLDPGDLTNRLKQFFEAAGFTAVDGVLEQITPLIQERIVTLDEAPEIAGFFFSETVSPEPEDLLGKKMSAEESLAAARRSYALLEEVHDFSPEALEAPMRQLAETLGLTAGQLFGLLRVATTGRKVSPPLFESMVVIGREKVLQRVRAAIQILEELTGERGN